MQHFTMRMFFIDHQFSTLVPDYGTEEEYIAVTVKTDHLPLEAILAPTIPASFRVDGMYEWSQLNGCNILKMVTAYCT